MHQTKRVILVHFDSACEKRPSRLTDTEVSRTLTGYSKRSMSPTWQGVSLRTVWKNSVEVMDDPVRERDRISRTAIPMFTAVTERATTSLSMAIA